MYEFVGEVIVGRISHRGLVAHVVVVVVVVVVLAAVDSG